MRKWFVWLLLLCLVVAVGYLAFFHQPNCETVGSPPEVPITTLPLADPLDSRLAEISGMDWFGDTLMILPQFPDFADEPSLYAIPKAALLAYLEDPAGEALEAIPIVVKSYETATTVPGFEGFEALAFSGNRVFLTVEASAGWEMQGYLVSGVIASDMSKIVLDEASMQPIDLPTQHFNAADEALLVAGDQLLTFYEANGAEANPEPAAQVFDLDRNSVGTLPFPKLEYRVTDATRLDAEDNFWVTNQFSYGSFWLPSGQDSLVDAYGEGCTHARYLAVERLVEMHYDPQRGISFTDTPPIQLKLTGDLSFRNWEAIVRLDDLGFLIATDKYPGTVLAFIPHP